jgi:hypothetical protein
VYAFVFVGDVEGAALGGDSYAFYAGEFWKFSDELGFQVAGAFVGWELAEEMGGYSVAALGMVFENYAAFLFAVDVAGDDV